MRSVAFFLLSFQKKYLVDCTSDSLHNNQSFAADVAESFAELEKSISVLPFLTESNVREEVRKALDSLEEADSQGSSQQQEFLGHLRTLLHKP